MTDLEQRIRQVLTDDARQAPRIERVPETVRPRIRRRQAATAVVAGLTLLAVSVASFATVKALSPSAQTIPVHPGNQVVFQRTATIDGFTVTSPSDWPMVDYRTAWSSITGRPLGSGPSPLWPPSPYAGIPIFQITNYDAGLGSPVCGTAKEGSMAGGNTLPRDGVVAYLGYDVAGVRVSQGTPAWPDALSPPPGGLSGCGVDAAGLWSNVERGGQAFPFFLWTAAGADASKADLTTLNAIRSSFTVAAGPAPLTSPTEAPAYVLDAGTHEDITWLVEAAPAAPTIDLHVLRTDPSGVTSVIGAPDINAPFLPIEGATFGVVTKDALQVELRPAAGGEPLQARIIPLPSSMQFPFNVFVFEQDPTVPGNVVAVGPAGDLSTPGPATPPTVSPTSTIPTPVGDRLASGTWPDGSTWTVDAVTQPSPRFRVTDTGPNVGAGYYSWQDKRPPTQEASMFAEWSQGRPVLVLGTVPRAVASVQAETDQGTLSFGSESLHALPSAFGPVRAFVFTLPPSTGDTTVYRVTLRFLGATGNEVAPPVHHL
jgi:hypothetical protein